MTSNGERKSSAPHQPETAPGESLPGDEQALRRDIEQTRAQLGATMQQLAAKADIKARLRAAAAGGSGPGIVAPLLAAAALILGIVAWRSSRNR